MDRYVLRDTVTEKMKMKPVENPYKCSIVARIVVEIITDRRIDNPPTQSNEDEYDVGGTFQGASYINVHRGDKGHRLAVIHDRGLHTLIQSNNLEDPLRGNVQFTHEMFIDNAIPGLDLHSCHPILVRPVSTVEYQEWLYRLKVCARIESPDDVRRAFAVTKELTGVAVDPTNVYVCTFPATMQL
jgi:hypothetical protein